LVDDRSFPAYWSFGFRKHDLYLNEMILTVNLLIFSEGRGSSECGEIRLGMEVTDCLSRMWMLSE
jgi:hypothetical protein